MALIGCVAAAMVAASMAAPLGASAAPPGRDTPQLAAPKDPAATAADDLYAHDGSTGFHRQDSTLLSDAAAAKLGTRDTELLQQAQVKDTPTVTVMMLAQRGATGQVVAAVEDNGGSVGSVTAKVGYVRATVPTEQVGRLAGLHAVTAIDLNRSYRVPTPHLGGTAASGPATSAAVQPTAPGKDTPADNPYLPVSETGATTFVADHPTADGRGVRVGVLDTGIDLDHPALQRTSDGKRKIVDWVTETDPVIDHDGAWVQMSLQKTGPTFVSAGKVWTAPPGTFQFGLFSEANTGGSELDGDVNRDGDTSDVFGVLYDPVSHQIWVDADNNRNFTDQPAIAPYADGGQIGHFGVDDPSTSLSEQVPFVVEYRDNVDLSPLGGSSVGKSANYVSIGIPSGSHATHVSGIIAGTSLFGGAMHGAAPGAQLVSARACTFNGGCTQSALTEGMIDLVVNKHVDVVNLSIGGLPALNDGSDVIAQLYNTLIDTYGVQIIVAAGNDGLGTNTVSSPAVSSRVIGVAASISSATWWADYGARVTAAQAIFGFSSRGPAEDGALAPSVAAPGAAVSALPTWLEGASVPESGYQLPVGYGMENGTSMATPEVTGATALLLSAADASNLAVTPSALRTALTDTARPIHGELTTAQGAGIIDTVAAWKQLAQGVRTNELQVSAPVCTTLSAHLEHPGTGPGVYNRCLPSAGGQVTGVPKTYQVQVTRTSGAAGSVVHRIGWIGDDGTFSARAALPLKPGQTGSVTVTATAAAAGVHSAIMTIDDPSTVGVDQLVEVTVLATEALTAPDYRVSKTGTLPRAGSTSFLVPVPEGVEALQLNLDAGAAGSQVRVVPIDPDGVPADSNASNHCYTEYSDPSGCNPTARPIYRPKAGVWEFVVEARRTSPVESNAFTASVSLQGMTFNPGAVTVDQATVNRPTAVSSTGTNSFGQVTAHVADGEVGFVRNLYAAVAQGQVTANQVDVPRSATRLDLKVTPRDANADLDFYVVSSRGIVADASTMGPGAERIVLDDPSPGSYFVVVTAVQVPGTSVTFDYHEEMYSQGLGTIRPRTDTTFRLTHGRSMPTDATMTLAARQLTSEPVVGRVTVANEYGTIIGAVNVKIPDVRMPQLDVVAWAPPFVGSAVTNEGVVAGDRQYNARMTPTTWTATDGFTNLDLGANTYGSVLGMNDARTGVGIVIGASHTMPAQWAADGSLTPLGVPDWRAYTTGYATAINDSGQVVGFANQLVRESDGYHTYCDPWVHTGGGGFTHLTHLSDNPAQTQPRAINDAGVVVGDSLTGTGASRAVRWNADTGAVTDLGVLPGQTSSSAHGINNTGEVVGVSGDDAFVWTQTVGMHRLADYGFNATADQVTDDGWILGTVELAPDYEVSALWDPQGRLWDVSGMIPSDSPFLPTYSFGINDHHDLMVYGEGGNAGVASSAVLLHVPDGLGG